MAASSLATRVCGLRVSVADSAAAATWLERVLPVPLDRPATSRWPRLQLAGRWLELRTGSGDTLDLQCADLGQQRTHLQRLGIDPLDGSSLGCTPCLRLDAMDTGACTVDLREAPAHEAAVHDGPEHESAPASSHAQLCGLELAVRSPERVALHWAQLFHAQAVRDTRGLPALSLDGIALRFVLAGDGCARVSAMDFGVPDVAALAHRASSQGIEVRQQRPGHAGFEAHGIRLRLRQAG